jgi:hypothetical protein
MTRDAVVQQKPMTASEAIRFGAMMNPQARFVRHAPDGSSCVLGAMEDAIGLGSDDEHFILRAQLLAERFPILRRRIAHPVTGHVYDLDKVIAGLNNNGWDYDCRPPRRLLKPWTRERIADWVETVERSLEPRQAAVQSTEPTPVITAQPTEESRLQLA